MDILTSLALYRATKNSYLTSLNTVLSDIDYVEILDLS